MEFLDKRDINRGITALLISQVVSLPRRLAILKQTNYKPQKMMQIIKEEGIVNGAFKGNMFATLSNTCTTITSSIVTWKLLTMFPKYSDFLFNMMEGYSNGTKGVILLTIGKVMNQSIFYPFSVFEARATTNMKITNGNILKTCYSGFLYNGIYALSLSSFFFFNNSLKFYFQDMQDAYDHIKNKRPLDKDKEYISLVGATILTTIVSHPFDTLRRRKQIQLPNNKINYTSGLFRGLIPKTIQNSIFIFSIAFFLDNSSFYDTIFKALKYV
eukprot:TRINITY_DN1200_c1_g1_i2.p1 TRINITY_DN1200_c1_g1~~TRINITY_DN1200_c1_g1_i2.p1  ORF type:complete len:271 (-),score=48.81 TRINITY_DN1200_c1_g1_i2:31-843(-)